MMRLCFDDDLVEAVVFWCARGRGGGVAAIEARRFHAERERCYGVADLDERNAAFGRLYMEWFKKWGWARALTNVLDEYPLLPEALNVLAFRQAKGRHEEGAELYVSDVPARHAMVAVRMERLEREESLQRFLRHELMHVHDMVDPAFGYSPELALPTHNPAQLRNTRERYRLFWDVTIDGRLARAGRAPLQSREEHEALFHRAFAFWAADKRDRVFDAHWQETAPRHENLLALAADPREVSRGSAPRPGASCPLCQFPTFEWVEPNAMSAAALAALREQFPHWTPDQGACHRCVEVYELAGRFAAPPTIVW